MVDKSAVLEAVSRHPWTAIVLTKDGDVAEMVAIDGELSAQAFLEFTRTHAQGRQFRLIKQSELSEAELNELIDHVLKPSSTPTERGIRLPEAEPTLDSCRTAKCIADAFAEFLTRYPS